MRRVREPLLLGGTMILLACGGSEPPPPATLGSPAGAGGSASTTGTGGGGGFLTPFAGMTGIGAFGGHLNVQPPATVDLLSCAAIVEGATDFGSQCSACCTGKSFVNHALFDGKCVCGGPVDTGATVCAARTDLFDCTSCCSGAAYRDSRVNLSVPDSCRCFAHYNTDVCSLAVTDSTPRNACAVCCINAGYIGSGIDFGCACSEG